MSSVTKINNSDQHQQIPERILIVDSSPLYSALIEGAVQKVYSGPIDIASNKSEMTALIEEHKGAYFLALMNMVLPDAPNGEAVEFVANIQVPAVVFTKSIEPDLIKQIEQIGAVDYLVKEKAASLDLVSKTVRRLDRNRKIVALVVDDVSESRAQSRKWLEKQLYTVEEAEDGVQAYEKVLNNDAIGLVVTGYSLPNMDGFELVRKLRSVKGARDLAIIGLAEGPHRNFASNFIRYGADDFMSKPIKVEEFRSRVSMCMDRVDLLNDLVERATIDPLTNIWNRQYFQNVSSTLYACAVRGQIDVDVAIIDIDHLKQINDTHGYDAGDEILKEVADSLSTVIRSTDLLARLDGDRFSLLTVNVEAEARGEFFNSLRDAIAELSFSFGGEEVKVTASIGVTSALGNTLGDMLMRAEETTQKAKEMGRNITHFAERIV